MAGNVPCCLLPGHVTLDCEPHASTALFSIAETLLAELLCDCGQVVVQCSDLRWQLPCAALRPCQGSLWALPSCLDNP